MIARLVFLIGLFLFPNAMTSCSKEEYKTYHHHEKQPLMKMTTRTRKMKFLQRCPVVTINY